MYDLIISVFFLNLTLKSCRTVVMLIIFKKAFENSDIIYIIMILFIK